MITDFKGSASILARHRHCGTKHHEFIIASKTFTMRLAILAILAGTVVLGPAFAQPKIQSFDPARLKGPQQLSPSVVLVLGTPHLSQLPKAFKPADLHGLIGRLAGWRPQAIAVEAVSGLQCDFMQRHSSRYSDSVKAYCWDRSSAQSSTGLDVAAATAQAEKLLEQWPDQPEPRERRQLAALFMAAGEPASALVQWLRLQSSERREDGALNAALVAQLEALQIQKNENTLIAARLAADLGHDRVFAVDDHTADAVIADEAAYGAAIEKAWDNPSNRHRKRIDEKLITGFGSSQGVLELYRAYNKPGMAELVFESDFGAALQETSPQQFGRRYVAYWETRNLRMAANIRDILAVRPGTRMLVIVGMSHKGYLDAYLNLMHDVKVADASLVLK